MRGQAQLFDVGFARRAGMTVVVLRGAGTPRLRAGGGIGDEGAAECNGTQRRVQESGWAGSGDDARGSWGKLGAGRGDGGSSNHGWEQAAGQQRPRPARVLVIFQKASRNASSFWRCSSIHSDKRRAAAHCGSRNWVPPRHTACNGPAVTQLAVRSATCQTRGAWPAARSAQRAARRAEVLIAASD